MDLGKFGFASYLSTTWKRRVHLDVSCLNWVGPGFPVFRCLSHFWVLYFMWPGFCSCSVCYIDFQMLLDCIEAVFFALSSSCVSEVGGMWVRNFTRSKTSWNFVVCFKFMLRFIGSFLFSSLMKESFVFPVSLWC